MKPREIQLRRRLRWTTAAFMAALVVSGVTAMPLETELAWACRAFGWTGPRIEPGPGPGLEGWLRHVWHGLEATNAAFPWMGYGFDWLAFGHVVIAIAFVGAWRDPVRNRWLYDFGLIACALVLPWAFFCGQARGIPLPWRLVDMAFGVVGVLPLWLCRRWTRELETVTGLSRKI